MIPWFKSAKPIPKTNSGWNIKDTMQRDSAMRGKKAVVIGGGTGAPVSIKTLLSMGVQTTAITAMTDDGGSTGLLRERAGAIPPGDVRKCIAAMAPDSNDTFVRAFKYRFNYAHNHTFGNLMLTALAENSSFEEAINICEKMMGSLGKVLPSTFEKITLNGKTRDGMELSGQATICYSPTALERVWLSPSAPAVNKAAIKAIIDADLIILGPGSLFTSIIPNILVPGIANAIRVSKARTMLILSIADMQGETWALSASEHVKALLDHGMQGILDIVCLNCDEKSGGIDFHEFAEKDGMATQEFKAIDDAMIESAAKRIVDGNKVVRLVSCASSEVKKINELVPVVIKRNLVDTIYPTWHSPQALAKVFKEVFQLVVRSNSKR